MGDGKTQSIFSLSLFLKKPRRITHQKTRCSHGNFILNLESRVSYWHLYSVLEKQGDKRIICDTLELSKSGIYCLCFPCRKKWGAMTLTSLTGLRISAGQKSAVRKFLLLYFIAYLKWSLVQFISTPIRVSSLYIHVFKALWITLDQCCRWMWICVLSFSTVNIWNSL